MKRLFLILFITTAMTVVSVAQPRAIGIRIGGNQEVTFQQGIHYGKRFVQFDVGSFYAKGLQITWTYNWLSQAIGNSAFSVYGGIGLGAGFIFGDNTNAWYPRFLDTKATDYMERKLNGHYDVTDLEDWQHNSDSNIVSIIYHLPYRSTIVR